jgi:hypothetical protein
MWKAGLRIRRCAAYPCSVASTIFISLNLLADIRVKNISPIKIVAFIRKIEADMFKQTFNNNSRPDEALYDLHLLTLQIVSGSDWTKIIRDEAQPAPEQEIPRKEPRSLMLGLCVFVVFLILYMGALIHLGQSIKTVAEQVGIQYVRQHTVNY